MTSCKRKFTHSFKKNSPGINTTLECEAIKSHQRSMLHKRRAQPHARSVLAQTLPAWQLCSAGRRRQNLLRVGIQYLSSATKFMLPSLGSVKEAGLGALWAACGWVCWPLCEPRLRWRMLKSRPSLTISSHRHSRPLLSAQHRYLKAQNPEWRQRLFPPPPFSRTLPF